MTFEFPQTPADWLSIIVPLVTLLVGLVFFLMPKLILRRIGLEGVEQHPEAIGEGRSSFAGFMIGLSLICLLFQQPILNQALTISWGITVIGKLVHLLVDGGLKQNAAVNIGRTVIAAVLAGYSHAQSGLPEFHLAMPVFLGEWLALITALVTFAFGLIALVLPTTALTILRLQPAKGLASAKGEPRGPLAGFYLGTSTLLLMNPDVSAVPGMFIGFALALCWIMTAFGRMISMLSDRGNNLFNWFSLLLELGLAALPLVVIFNLLH